MSVFKFICLEIARNAPRLSSAVGETEFSKFVSHSKHTVAGYFPLIAERHAVVERTETDCHLRLSLRQTHRHLVVMVAVCLVLAPRLGPGFVESGMRNLHFRVASKPPLTSDDPHQRRINYSVFIYSHTICGIAPGIEGKLHSNAPVRRSDAG